MKRVNSPSKHIKGIVENGKKYYIGFGIKNLTELGKDHKGLNQLIAGVKTSLLVTGKSGTLRENTKGKMVRKQPENKVSIWKHIHFYSARFGHDIDYDREFNVWEKELLHKYELELEVAKTPQGEIVVHFPMFVMEDTEAHYMKAGAAMNMCIALGGYFLPYDYKFEPIVPVTIFEQRRILPPGNQTLAEKLEIIENNIKRESSGETSTGNSYRFAMLKAQNPKDVTMGLGGFDEYLMFEYPRHNLMVLENLKSGNATYLFDLAKFNKKKSLNKQMAQAEPGFLKRIVHENIISWSNQMSNYFPPEPPLEVAS